MRIGPLADHSSALAFLRVNILQDIPHEECDSPFEPLIKDKGAKTGNNTDHYGDDDSPFCRCEAGGERIFHGFCGFFTFSPDSISGFLLRAGEFSRMILCPAFFETGVFAAHRDPGKPAIKTGL
jgi:hypothetical protein